MEVNLDVYINLEIYTFGPCNYKTNELGEFINCPLNEIFSF